MLQEPIRRIRSGIGSHGLVHERLGADHVSVEPAPIRCSHSSTGVDRDRTLCWKPITVCRLWRTETRTRIPVLAPLRTGERDRGPLSGRLADRHGEDGPAKRRGSVPIADDHGDPQTASIDSLSIEASGTGCLQSERRRRVLQPSRRRRPFRWRERRRNTRHSVLLPRTILPKPFR